ncbi:MAG: DUF2064 domain-containing protein [Euryarchaeota archaeon]|nr:DUF2064 domain-containing protein [Euryarchaeota archaeon]MDE1837095.1 DUF2064 domain-containing protein [Euryarchaeota archaeon]MDE1879693.1 DUF2064 domain-containing protein [Euryarchaeota archaeon]MDE2045219.1 DUF2064 domain-containing protein [Thermoplasmata archaeon]
MAATRTPSTGRESGEELLIVFGHVPSLGVGLKEITRAHGPQAAYSLQRHLLDTCLQHASEVAVRKWFRYPVGTPAPPLANDWSSRPHEPGPIGELITVAMAEGFERGFQRIVLFYADCPSLVPEFLESAFEALENGDDLVLGPTRRGGLYLVGADRKVGDLFGSLPWGTHQVFAVAQRHAQEGHLRVFVLPPKVAVEYLEDWREAASEGWIPPPPVVSGGSGRPEG